MRLSPSGLYTSDLALIDDLARLDWSTIISLGAIPTLEASTPLEYLASLEYILVGSLVAGSYLGGLSIKKYQSCFQPQEFLQSPPKFWSDLPQHL